MGSGPLDSVKLHLVAKFNFGDSRPVGNRPLFQSCSASPNVEKCDQDGSAWVKVP